MNKYKYFTNICTRILDKLKKKSPLSKGKMVSSVVNRDGTRAKFDMSRIEVAIEKALHACTGKDEKLGSMLKYGKSIQSLSKDMASIVMQSIDEYVPNRLITVELIQDVVERQLMEHGFFVTAKEYILYRAEHARMRRKFLSSKVVPPTHNLFVVKRDESLQPMSKDKIFKRIRRKCECEPVLKCDPTIVAEKVVLGVYNKVTTQELDALAITIAKDMVIKHPDYEKLASRIAISGHQKDTKYLRCKMDKDHIRTQIAFAADAMYHNLDQNSDPAPLIQKELYEFIITNQDEIDDEIDYEQDFDINLFGFQTLTRAYLMKAMPPEFTKRRMVERPQDMFMRVALGIHCVPPNKWTEFLDKPSQYEERENMYISDKDLAVELNFKRKTFEPDLDAAIETYHLMSRGYFIHATPTLIYAGTTRPGLSSCFLVAMDSDSIKGIYKTLSDCALISKNAGGVGLHIHKIRSNGSYIRGTAGESDGIVPMLKVFNDTAKYVNQGGKRKGAFAVYLACWHADIEDFLQLKLPHGQENKRARDLFYAFWRNDYFMECVIEDRDWYLMCPDECPGLAEVYGDDFVELYETYVEQGKYHKVVKARDIYKLCLKARAESGVPYIGEKDSINRKSNQSNLGVIQSSNLCCEIALYSDPQETAVCNLNSIALPKFVKTCKDGTKYIDHAHLHEVAQIITRNINKVIDRNYYPTPESARSNYRHRPIGIGVQGLWDVFMMFRVPFGSPEAIQIDKEIFETIYHGALTASRELAVEEGEYVTFRFGKGSPLSRGKFQFDLWAGETKHSGRWDWESLRENIMRDGVRNSELIAPMPTASTSQILGNVECTEPIKSNLYKRKTSSGEFIILNKYLYADIERLGLDIHTIREQIEANDGSIQNIAAIPDDLKALYTTVWEMDQRLIIDHCAARSVYVTQACSMNLYLKLVEPDVLTEIDLYAWKKGLKTQYYTHSKSATKAKQHHDSKYHDSSKGKDPVNSDFKIEGAVCTMEEGCIMCGS